MVYKFREGVHYRVPAQVIGTRVEKIRKKNGGLSPEAVLEDARSARSPIHRCFTWDDTKAAEKWRRAEARRLITCFVVVVSASIPARQGEVPYIGVGTRTTGSYFKTRLEVVSDDYLRDRALAEALRQLRGLQKRYKGIEELARVFRTVDEDFGEAQEEFAFEAKEAAC